MTTKRTQRPNQQLGLLKTILVVGSLAATLVGTKLLSAQDRTAVSPTDSTVVLPAGEEFPLPPNSGNRNTQIQLAPIPQAAVPNFNIVARSRSSR